METYEGRQPPKKQIRHRQARVNYVHTLVDQKTGHFGLQMFSLLFFSCLWKKNKQIHSDRWLPCPSFPCFLWKRQGKPPKKQGFFIPTEPLKSLEKKGKTLTKKQGIPRKEKEQGMPKKQGKEGQGVPSKKNVQERKISPKRKFLGRTSRGHPGVIRADIPAQNFGQDGQNPGKTSISARTSMTRRRGRPRP